MIGLFVARQLPDADTLVAQVRRKTALRVTREFGARGAEALVRTALSDAKDFDEFLIRVGRFFGSPGTRGVVRSAVPQNWIPRGAIPIDVMEVAYGAPKGERGVWTLHGGDLAVFADRWSRMRTESREAQEWLRLVADVLDAAMKLGLDVVFVWFVRDVGVDIGGVEWTVLPLRLEDVKSSFDGGGLERFHRARKAYIDVEIEDELSPLGKHPCKAWMLSQTVSGAKKLVLDDSIDEVAAWYLLMAAGVSSPFERDHVEDFTLPLDTSITRKLGGLNGLLNASQPDARIIEKIQAYWRSPNPSLLWAQICLRGTRSLIPKVDVLSKKALESAEGLFLIRCTRYDEYW